MLKLSEEKLVIIVAALSQLSVQLIANMATIIIPEISIEMGLSIDIQLYINIIYLCALVGFSIPLAMTISKYGVKKSIRKSCILLIISLFLCGFSFNFIMILIARVLQGICCASLGISIYMMMVEEMDDEDLGAALGLVGSCGYVGLMLAPSLTGFITFYTDWRTPFLLLIPFFVVQLILLHNIKSEWTRPDIPIDNIGSLIYLIIMVMFTIGLTEIDGVTNFLLLLSILLIPVFVRYEKGKEFPILNVKLFKNLKIMIGANAAMVTYFATTIAITVLTFHLIYPGDMDLNMVGLILLVTPFTMVFVSIFAGKLTRKYDPRLISGIGLLIIAGSMVMLACLTYMTTELIILACVLQGVGHGLFSSPNNKYVLTLPDEEDLANTSAILSTSKEFGKILSNSIYTILFVYLMEGVVLGPEEFDGALMFTNHVMMAITEIFAVVAALLLFYSLWKHTRYENPRIVRMAYRLMPKSLRKRRGADIDIDEDEDGSLRLRDVMNMSYMKAKAADLKDTTVNTAVNIKDTTVDAATSIKDTSVDTASNLKDKIK